MSHGRDAAQEEDVTRGKCVATVPRLLLLRFGVFMSKQDINMGKYELLSRRYAGDIFEKVFRPELRQFAVGRFRFKGLRIAGLTRRVRVVGNLVFCLFVILHTMVRQRRTGRYAYIVTYDPFGAGMLGLLLARIYGCRLICEVNGNYGEKKTWVGSGSDLAGLLKYYYCRAVIPFVINRAYATKLLYSEQLQSFGGRIKARNIHVFHEYTPVLSQKLTSTRGDYVLFLGSPWDVKGVDVLIKAFRRISGRFQRFQLRIVGWFPEPGLGYLKELAGNDPNIEICRPVHYDEAMQLVAASYLVVLPSRSEGMGRVLLEAMSYGKPVVAARVDGIPTYVKEEVNGLLFQSENDLELSEKIGRLLSDPSAAGDLGQRGYRYVREHLSEEKYLECYCAMLSGASGRVWV